MPKHTCLYRRFETGWACSVIVIFETSKASCYVKQSTCTTPRANLHRAVPLHVPIYAVLRRSNTFATCPTRATSKMWQRCCPSPSPSCRAPSPKVWGKKGQEGVRYKVWGKKGHGTARTGKEGHCITFVNKSDRSQLCCDARHGTWRCKIFLFFV